MGRIFIRFILCFLDKSQNVFMLHIYIFNSKFEITINLIRKK